MIFILWVMILSNQLVAEDCNIFIHGYTPDGRGYFGDVPRQVVWDSSKDLEDSAPKVAKKVLDQIKTCPNDSDVILRPHSYGAAQVHYILGKGRQFQSVFPEHDYVQIYKRVLEVYAYTGAYHGTPLMDLICSGKKTRSVASFFGRKCVKTLTTSKVFNVHSHVPSSGVPTYLLYSSDRSGGLGIPGAFLSTHLVGWREYVFGRVRNQNDNTLPLYSTRGCSRKKVMSRPEDSCRILDSNFFVDFHHIKHKNHNGFLEDEDIMFMRDGDY